MCKRCRKLTRCALICCQMIATGGIYSDYFNVACRTGEEGSGGLTMLLVKREFGGVTTRKMDATGWWASGTTYITFEDTRVPAEYVVRQSSPASTFVYAFDGSGAILFF
eukprot:SAG31_NODE_1158_length_9605_cov_2.788555_8_plen_109_part_00